MSLLSFVVLAASGQNTISPLSVTANNVSKFNPTVDPVLVTSNTPGTVVSGGVAPYFYSWARVSGDTRPACSNTAIANPTWSATIQNETASATWRLTVTDSGGSTPVTADIFVELTAGL